MLYSDYGAAEDNVLAAAARQDKVGRVERFLRRGVLAMVAAGCLCGAAYSLGAPRPLLALDARAPALRRIYYLNCDGAADRKALMENHLSEFGVPFERVPCVAGDSMEEVLGTEDLRRRFGRKALRAPRDHDAADEKTRARTVARTRPKAIFRALGPERKALGRSTQTSSTLIYHIYMKTYYTHAHTHKKGRRQLSGRAHVQSLQSQQPRPAATAPT